MRNLPVFTDLRAFLDWAEAQSDLTQLKQPVAVEHEMTAIQLAALRRSGPVLRFDRAQSRGAPANMPVISNLFGTPERVAAGLGMTLEKVPQLGAFLAELRAPAPIEGMKDALSRWPMLHAALQTHPKLRRVGPCQEVDATVDLTALPVQTPWPEDAGPLITWPVVITRPAASRRKDTAHYNLGVYRAQVLGPDRLIMRWLAHRGGAAHHRTWQAKGEKMPAAIALGADPATLLSAALPLPETVSELSFSGVLRGARTELVPARSVPLLVPAHAEIIIEGWIDPTETAPEGPFGDHTGYYNTVELFPVMQVSAITHRHDPVYLSTVTGRPPDEPSVIGEVFNTLSLPVIRGQIPEITDLWLPPAACSYRMAVIQIDKRYPGQARRVMTALWGMLPQFSYTKTLVVVDQDIDPRNWDDVAWALATRMDPARDVMLLTDTPMDYLDFASMKEGLSGKLGLDATTKVGTETSRDWGKVMQLDPDHIAYAERILAEAGL
jgi:4-hydroxy-3-polyprenylbenzoate decarboxylase